MSKVTSGQLTDRQELFCKEYLKDMNATQAAIRAGYKADNADVVGPRLVGKSWVASRLKELMAKRTKRYDISAERVLEELASIAYARMPDYVTFNESGVRVKESSELTKRQSAAIAEVSEIVTQNGGTTKVKLHDKTKALELLGKYQKIFTDKVEHSGTVRLEQLIASSQDDPEGEC